MVLGSGGADVGGDAGFGGKDKGTKWPLKIDWGNAVLLKGLKVLVAVEVRGGIPETPI